MGGKTKTSFVKGQVTNPKGRPAKTDEQRAAEDYLREKSHHAAMRLVQLIDSDDEKIAMGSAQAVLKITLGDTVRAPVDEEGRTVGAVDAEEIARRARDMVAARRLVKP